MTIMHTEFLGKISNTLKTDNRILGLAIGGSYITRDMDEYSDLDFVLAIDPNYYDEVMQNGISIVDNLGNLLSAFTGEHVGEPRLIIALYDVNEYLIHVDFKFVSLNDISVRVEDPVILWEREKCISNEFANPMLSSLHFLTRTSKINSGFGYTMLLLKLEEVKYLKQ